MSISSKIFTWSSPSKHSLQNLSIPPPLTYTPVPWLASAPPQQDSHAQADSLPTATAATRPLETALGTCGPTVHIQLWPMVNVSDKGRKVLFTANCKRLYMTGIRDVVSNSLSLWISMHLWEGEKISIPWNTLDCPSLLQSKWIVNLSTSLAQVQRAITLPNAVQPELQLCVLMSSDGLCVCAWEEEWQETVSSPASDVLLFSALFLTTDGIFWQATIIHWHRS